MKHTSGYPPYLYVEDVTTLSTPHRGMNPYLAFGCNYLVVPTPAQCVDMTTGSDFLNGLHDNPQAADGTDWTLVGADDDTVVPVWSSVPDIHADFRGSMSVGHKVIYDGNQFSDAHSQIHTVTSGAFKYWYCDYYDTSCNMADRSTFHYRQPDGVDPIKMARLGNYYYSVY